MSRIRRFVVIAVLGTALVSACSSGAGSTADTATSSRALASASASAEAVTDAVSAVFADRNADGEALANAWFGLLAKTGSAAGVTGGTSEKAKAGAELVRPYLDSSFQVQRASGERYTRGNYIPTNIGKFAISDVVVTAPRDDIRVVRYAVSTPGATQLDSGMVMSDALAPRLTVLKWDEALGHWVLVSHANFNTPAAAICDQQPVRADAEVTNTDAETQALGESLVEQWRDITTGVVKENVRHVDGQIQLADGQGWPTKDGSEIKWTPASAYDFGDLVVTRNGDLLVATYDVRVKDIVMEGDEFASVGSPRLLTYLQNPEGKWELIALGNFSVPQQVPSDLDCVAAGS